MLRWYIEGQIGRPKTEVAGTHTLDVDYIPVRVAMTARIASKGDDSTIVDITADNVSIFSDRPALDSQNVKVWTTIPGNVIRKDSVMRLDIVQVANLTYCRDLTIELELSEA